jgi:hypothetical protein
MKLDGLLVECCYEVGGSGKKWVRAANRLMKEK